MNFKRLVALEVHLRLTDYLKGFVYSVRRGWFYKRLMSFSGASPAAYASIGGDHSMLFAGDGNDSRWC